MLYSSSVTKKSNKYTTGQKRAQKEKKMAKFKIVVDSTVDLTPELLKLIDPVMVPLNVHMGELTFQDHVDLDADGLYAKMKELNAVPKTSAASPGLFLETFEKLRDEGHKEILYVGIGTAFSATHQAATLALEDLKGVKVRLVDSHSLSSGGGLLALRAHDLREEGKSLDEVADYLSTLGPKVRAQFIVDNLDMLAAGGRVTGMKLFFGRILRAHPYLQINDDKLEVAATPKGKIEKALDVMLDVAEKEITEGLESPRVTITHSHGGERIDYVLERLTKVMPRENIIVTNAGAVISSHCGEGTVGILYIRK